MRPVLPKKVLVLGAGSGIGKSILENVKTQSSVFAIGGSRRGFVLPNKFPTPRLPFSEMEDEPNEEFVSGKNYCLDVLDEKSRKAFFDAYKSYFDTIDVVYFCFGDGIFKPFTKTTTNEFENHIQLNLVAVFNLLKDVYPFLILSKNAHIIFLGSTASKMGFPESSAYCASKHGLVGLARSLREEWKDQIRVTAVLLGAVATSIWNGREDFSLEDMISEEDAGAYLASLTQIPHSVSLDEITVLPKKGIL